MPCTSGIMNGETVMGIASGGGILLMSRFGFMRLTGSNLKIA
jgi:hypothetical protein